MTRKLLLTILLFVASMASRAQTKESDAIFAQGVSLYNKGKYKVPSTCSRGATPSTP